MPRNLWITAIFAIAAASAPALGDATEMKADPGDRTQGVATRTVHVNCDKGKSIQAALDKAQGPIVVGVHGLCHENVRVTSNNVTLRGEDPERDGIRGVATDPLAVAALSIEYALGVNIENLSISESPFGGVSVFSSEVHMQKCHIEANAADGLGGWASLFHGTELVISNNARAGFSVTRGNFFCTGCRLEANGSWAASSLTAGYLKLLDSIVSGGLGLSASFGAFAFLDCASADTPYPCNLTASDRAVDAIDDSSVELRGVVGFQGRIRASGRSNVLLHGSRQETEELPTSGRNRLDSFATMTTEGDSIVGTSQLGIPTDVTEFARLLLREGSLPTPLAGPPSRCSSGGDAYAAPGVVVPVGQFTGCAHLP